MTDHYDVIVIGSGAGGGTLTHALAPTGKRILLPERGTTSAWNENKTKVLHSHGPPARTG